MTTIDPPDVAIRLATEGDVPALEACAEAAYSRYVDRMDREPAAMRADFSGAVSRGEAIVAVIADKVVGYVVCYGRSGHLHLGNVAVFPDHSGMGIGRLLIDQVEQQARQLGYPAVDLYTNEVMRENLVMYPRLGYRETQGDGGWFPACLLHKNPLRQIEVRLAC